MFDFEKLKVYQKAKEARKLLFALLANSHHVDKALFDQLKRAALSIVLNIAEGTGKSSSADKKNFFTIARGSTYEVVAIIDLLSDDKVINELQQKELYAVFEEISKMLLGLINSI
ncbi:MAG: four helix bundle protein [Candidatus Margulisiibacteriota bacterium]